jgi:hypothetical protein
MSSLQKFLDCIESEMKSQGQNSYSTPNTESATNKIPETKHIVGINSEFRSLRNVSRASADMSLGNESDIIDTAFCILSNEPLFTAFCIENSFSSCKSFRIDQN